MKKLTYLFLLTAALFTSCEKDGIEGPNLNDLFGELNIIENFMIVGDSANFVSESAYFTAKFSKIVDWKISITGLSSGAEKIILGKSNEINATNSLWRGEVSLLPFFREENCSVLLTFPSHSDTISDYFVINEAKNYGNGSELVVSDFENGFNPNFTNFFQSTCLKKIETGDAGQSDRFLVQEGTCDWDWLIGYIDYPANHWLQQGTLNANPDNVYFNMMIKGDSTLSPTNEANSLFKLEFYEDENQDGYYDQNTEDRLEVEFDVNWNGWKMYSIKYSDLILAWNSGGNAIREPNKILKFRTLLLANPESGFAKADVDYIVWSEGSPIINQ